MALNFNVETPVADILEIGKALYYPFSGWVFDKEREVVNVSIIFGKKEFKASSTHFFRRDVLQVFEAKAFNYRALYSGFFIPITFTPEDIGEDIEFFLKISFENSETIQPIGKMTIVKELQWEKVSNKSTEKDEAIAICMATYSPSLDRFEEQLDSIINQSHTNWVLIINDDGSSSGIFRGLKKIASKDPRVHVFRNNKNLGFYRNFEACLARVGSGFDYIAFSDQDDYWYQEKLEVCVAEIKKGYSLVYSDMKIVDGEKNVLFPSYWTKRKNHYQDIRLMLTANTVTGAACLFKSELVEDLLPFPPKIGDIFHDQWLSVLAMSSGDIGYINKPLYDYVQHGSNVLGHTELNSPTSLDSKRYAMDQLNSTIRLFTRPSTKGHDAYIDNFINVYLAEYRRFTAIIETLYLRLDHKHHNRIKPLNVYRIEKRAPKALKSFHEKILHDQDFTGNAELRIRNSIKLVRNIERRRKLLYFLLNIPILSKFLTRTEDLVESAAVPQARASVNNKPNYSHFFEKKVESLNLKLSSEEPRRINFLIPEINFKYLFGGYLAKLNFSILLEEVGLNVRLILTDQVILDEEKSEEALLGYNGLENLLDKIEVVTAGNRNKEVFFNPEDSFIASTWWTAHIAYKACKALKSKKFLYFIQEYEPFTFPMGSFFAHAHQSYTFPHLAMFSSPQLRDYFQLNKIGIYSVPEENRILAQAFENAIVKFPKIIQNKGEKKKLLLYARPESHAARNMFEMGIMALRLAVKSGFFPEDEWEFHGIGSTAYPQIELGEKQVLLLRGKVNLDDYQELLPEFDLGMSLMYTPHPSLLPLEMAAAGMIVVTTTCLNKTDEELSGISSNILGANPTVEGIAESLGEAAKLCFDLKRRKDGADVNWSNEWNRTFPPKLIKKIKENVENGVI